MLILEHCILVPNVKPDDVFRSGIVSLVLTFASLYVRVKKNAFRSVDVSLVLCVLVCSE